MIRSLAMAPAGAVALFFYSRSFSMSKLFFDDVTDVETTDNRDKQIVGEVAVIADTNRMSERPAKTVTPQDVDDEKNNPTDLTPVQHELKEGETYSDIKKEDFIHVIKIGSGTGYVHFTLKDGVVEFMKMGLDVPNLGRTNARDLVSSAIHPVNMSEFPTLAESIKSFHSETGL
jgi:hypothetical protein